MHTDLALGCLCLLLSLAQVARADLVVNNCDDAKAWKGGSAETALVKEGKGAIRWVPAEHVELACDAVPHDWTAGNALRMWIHSAKATGSPIWIIMPSEDPAQEGPDYYCLTLRLDWEGWREVLAPFDEIDRARHPVGWHKIEGLRFHAAWSQDIKPTPEDALVIDDIRAVTIAPPGKGPRMTDQEFFEALDLARPGLEGVKAAVGEGDLEKAKAEFRRYFLARRDVKWSTNWWERPKPPEKRPSTSAADQTMKHIYNFDGKSYELGPDIDWSSNQRNEGEAATVEWNAALNRHFMFRSLADGYWSTGEEKYANELADMWTDWIRKAPVLVLSSGNGPYHWAWETLNTACRAGDTWPEALWRTADAPAWTPDALVMVVKSLAEHARHLVKNPTSANWLTAESKAVVIVGTLLPEFKEAESWRRIGIQRLYNQMDKEVYPDGIENELALGYGLWVLSNYANIFDLEILNGRRAEIPANYQALLERMYNYVLYAMGPDWATPGFNDSWSSDVRGQLQKAAEYFPQRKDFLWGATRGKSGERPTKTSTAFEYSGHYAMRSGWDPDARFLFLDAGPFGSGHQHEDKLTFFMSAYGKQWITEGGVYMYDASRWRKYVLSTRAHNTARVDGQDQARNGLRETYVLPYPFKPLDNPWLTSPDADYVSGVYDDGYGPGRKIKVRHQREILFVKPDYWIIADTFDPGDKAAHEYETMFHINADQAATEGTRVSARVEGKGLDLIGVGKDLSVSVVKGVQDEPVQGWAGGPWRPVPTALFHNAAAGRVRNLYVMFPSENAANAPVVKALEGPGQATGLSAQLPDGETHYFVKLGPEARGAGPVTVGPVTTDADLCLVKVSREGKVSGVFLIGGTQVMFDGAQVWGK